MRNYLILEAKSRRSAPTPRCRHALRAARVDQLARADAGRRARPRRRCAAEAGFDPDAAGRRGMGFERLDQLALEHLYGVRG